MKETHDENDARNELAAFFKDCLEKAGLSQKDLLSQIHRETQYGTTLPQLSSYKSGAEHIPSAVFRAICDILKERTQQKTDERLKFTRQDEEKLHLLFRKVRELFLTRKRGKNNSQSMSGVNSQKSRDPRQPSSEESILSTTSSDPRLLLPPPPNPSHPFIGREDQKQDIVDALQLGRVIALSGPGGIGKSALLSHTFHEWAADEQPRDPFSGGIFYYDFYDREASATRCFSEIVRFFEGKKEDEQTWVQAALNILRRRRVLILFDGVDEEAHIMGLNRFLSEIDPLNCIIFVTRRNRFADKAHKTIKVDVLSEIFALAALQAWAGGGIIEEREGKQICEMVGGLPLAISLAGRYIKNLVTPHELLREFETDPFHPLHFADRHNESVRYLLEKITKRLDDYAKSILAGIGQLAYAPFDYDMLITVFRSRPQLVDKFLPSIERIEDLNLLAKHETKRKVSFYQVTHRLVHTFAREHLAKHAPPFIDAEVAEALRSKNEVPLDKIPHILDLLEHRSPFNKYEALNIITLVQLIASACDQHGLWEELLTALDRAIQAAQHVKQLEHQKNQIAFLKHKAEILARLNRYPAAEATVQQALDLAEKIQGRSPNLLGQCYEIQGEIFEQQRKYEEARAAYVKAEVIYAAPGIDDDNGQAVCLCRQANIYRKVGDLAKAQNLYSAAREKAAKSRVIARCRNGIGWIAFDNGQFQQAYQEFAEVYQLYNDIRPPDYRSAAARLCDMGEVRLYQGNLPTAIEHLENAVALTRDALTKEKGYEQDLVHTLRMLGIGYRTAGRIIEATSIFQRAYDLAKKLKSSMSLARCAYNLGLCYRDVWFREQDVSYLKAIEFLEQAIDWDPNFERSYDSLGDICINANKLKEASWHYLERIERQPSTALRAFVNLGIISHHEGDVDKATENCERAVEIWNSPSFYRRYQALPENREDYALALLILGRPAEAQEQVADALQKARPGDVFWPVRYDLLASSPFLTDLTICRQLLHKFLADRTLPERKENRSSQTR